MKRMLAAAVLISCAMAARADAVLEYSGASAECHGDFARVAMQGLSMRIDSAPPAQDMSMVYDAAEKTGVALDHRRRQFFEMEFDDDAIDFQGDVMRSTSNMIDRKTEKMQAQLPQGSMPPGSMQPGANGMAQVDTKMIEQMMQQNMQNMPAEQRARMEQAMKNMRASGYPGFGTPQSEPVTEATGERREIGGLSCAVERVSRDGILLREDCRTPLDALGLDAADLKRMQRAILRMQKYAGAIKDNLRLARGLKRDTADPQHLLVGRRCFEQGRASGEVTLSVRHETAPAEWFVTPSDYARMDLGMRAH